MSRTVELFVTATHRCRHVNDQGNGCWLQFKEPIRSIEEEPRRLTDMLLRYNEVMLRGCRASITEHDILAILEIDGMSIVILRTRRVDVEGRGHRQRISGNLLRRQH